MTGSLLYLVPLALLLGAVALGAFLWSLNSGQYDDLDGAAQRILIDVEDDRIDGGAEPSASEAGEPDEKRG
jgi:cbb3-type cytochrome oxidase maturation protein